MSPANDRGCNPLMIPSSSEICYKIYADDSPPKENCIKLRELLGNDISWEKQLNLPVLRNNTDLLNALDK